MVASSSSVSSSAFAERVINKIASLMREQLHEPKNVIIPAMAGLLMEQVPGLTKNEATILAVKGYMVATK